jgi:flagellar basal body-associated protein FliL
MKQQVLTWLAVVVIVLVLAIVAVIFWFSGRQRSEQAPAGFKPQPPQFKATPAEKR